MIDPDGSRRIPACPDLVPGYFFAVLAGKSKFFQIFNQEILTIDGFCLLKSRVLPHI